jgi:hypothetical protein
MHIHVSIKNAQLQTLWIYYVRVWNCSVTENGDRDWDFVSRPLGITFVHLVVVLAISVSLSPKRLKVAKSRWYVHSGVFGPNQPEWSFLTISQIQKWHWTDTKLSNSLTWTSTTLHPPGSNLINFHLVLFRFSMDASSSMRKVTNR